MSISITLNENGLFEKANKAKIETNKGTIHQEIELAVLDSRFEEENLGRITESKLEDNLQEIDVDIIERDEVDENLSTLPWKVTKGGFVYTIDEAGNVRFESDGDNPVPDNPTPDNPEQTDETTEAEAVASSEENGVKKYYKTIDSAISNIQQEGIVELLENSEVTSTLQIENTQKIELKTNGKVLSSATTNVLRNAGNLTINGAGTISTTGENAYAITNVGTLNTDSLTINSTYRGIYNTGTSSLKATTVSASDIAIRNLENGIISANSGTILQATATGDVASYGIYSTSTNENAVIVNGGKIISNSGNGTAYGIRNTATGRIQLTGGATIEVISSNGVAQGVRNEAETMVEVTGTRLWETKITAKATATGKNGYGIYMGAGTLKLWNTTTDLDINTNFPEISGSTYGVYIVKSDENNGFEFYDGKIIGKTAIYGTVKTRPDGTEIKTTTDDAGTQTVILQK